ncbi:MAG: threonylcarbamoyl-AMP synthase, partial [Thaumarchaeota archaeon]
ALTIVLPLMMELPELIHQGSGTLAVRVPNSRRCLELISACGGYLIGTSANKSGKPACRTAHEALRSIGEEVDLILDGGRLSEKESTVVKVSGNRVELLRSGAVTFANLP